MIGFEQAAKPFDANNFSIFIGFMKWLNDFAQRLVNPLVMIILTIIFQNILQLRYRR